MAGGHAPLLSEWGEKRVVHWTPTDVTCQATISLGTSIESPPAPSKSSFASLRFAPTDRVPPPNIRGLLLIPSAEPAPRESPNRVIGNSRWRRRPLRQNVDRDMHFSDIRSRDNGPGKQCAFKLP